MLRIYFGNKEGAVLSGNGYFDSIVDESCVKTDFFRKMIKDISGADVDEYGKIIHSIFGEIPVKELAGSIKALLILMYDDDYGFLDLASMGNNCMGYVRSIAQIKDITVCTDTWRSGIMQDGDKVLVLNSNCEVSTEDDLYREWVKTLDR